MSEYKSGYMVALLDVREEFIYRAAHEDVTYKMVIHMMDEIIQDAGSE